MKTSTIVKTSTITLFRSRAAALLLAIVSLSSAGKLGAQAVSNLPQGTVSNVFSVGGSPSRTLLFSFTTGATAASFDLSGVTINFGNSSNGSPNGVTLQLFSSAATGVPTGSAATFNSDTPIMNNISAVTSKTSLTLDGGTQPTTAGLYSFSGSVSLLSSTTYFLELAAPGSAILPAYNVPLSNTLNQTGLAGWLIGDASFVKESGNWLVSSGPAYGVGAPPSFSIQASAIPEPSTYAAIAGAAMLGLAVWQRRRKPAVAAVPAALSAA